MVHVHFSVWYNSYDLRVKFQKYYLNANFRVFEISLSTTVFYTRLNCVFTAFVQRIAGEIVANEKRLHII